MRDTNDTPETDDHSMSNPYQGEVVPASFARELERENMRFREALEYIRDHGMSMTKEVIVRLAERGMNMKGQP